MERVNNSIKLVTARPTVEIHLLDGRVLSGPRGSTVASFLQILPEWNNPPIVGCIINEELRELTYTVQMDSRVKPVTMLDADGAMIYRRSLTFLLAAAFRELFPAGDIEVDHSLSSGGYYCQVIGRPPLSSEELESLEHRMHLMVAADQPFTRQQVPMEDVMRYFEEKGQTDKVRLLHYRQKSHLILYQLGKHRDYYHGYMVPSTGYIHWFALSPMGDGFVLRFPRRHTQTEIQPLPESRRLLAVFRQYGDWLERLGIEHVGALNDAIESGRAREIILISEALHEQQLAEISVKIVSELQRIHVILIAGPSSSGKTTFSKRLVVQLLAQSVSPFALELDNYFLDREKTPKDEHGDYDFEALEALDTDLLTDHIRRLVSGEEIQMPKYNFKTGKSEPGEIVKLLPGQLIILEGIHGLNPRLLPEISKEHLFRIYVSCLTQLNLDRHNRISTTDTRLIRRIVRDDRERGYNALDTIQSWQRVRRGEQRNIFPYQDNADAMFNSALVYELSALKSLAEPALRQLPFGTPEYIEAKRLLAFLEWFLPIDQALIPDDSIMREFVGGSILNGFKLWDRTD